MPDEVTPADARTFLSDFVADPTTLESMSDADVVSLHGRVSEGVTKHSQAPDWMAGADDATRGYIQNKGFKNPLEVVTGYQNLEKLRGVPSERLLQLPENVTDGESMRAVYERLGAGKTAEDYKLPVPEGDNGEYAKEAAKWMHELGIPVHLGVKLAEKQNEYITQQREAITTQISERQAEQQEALKTDWGDKYDRNFTVAKGAAHTLGLDKETVDKLESVFGYDGTFKLLHTIGQKFGEDRFISGDGLVNLTPSQEEARAEIEMLKKDKEFSKKMVNGDVEANKKMQTLMKIAYSGERAA